MAIHYKTEGCFCITKCLYKKDKMVGSIVCVTCEYHVSKDRITKTVICMLDKDYVQDTQMDIKNILGIKRKGLLR